jgi:hypothetical protein
MIGRKKKKKKKIKHRLILAIYKTHSCTQQTRKYRQVFEIHEDLSMTREAPRISVWVVPWDERVVPEAHALAGEVHAEGPVEARVDRGLHGAEPHRVGIDPWGVDPSASHLVALLEDHHAETRKPELSSRYETGGASSDHGHMARRD